MKLKRLIILKMLLIAFSSCITYTKHVSIKELEQNPHAYANTSVAIKGIVTDSINLPLKEGGVYRIFEDNKYSVWVYTKKELPERGSKIEATGLLKYNKNFTSFFTGAYLIEKSRFE